MTFPVRSSAICFSLMLILLAACRQASEPASTAAQSALPNDQAAATISAPPDAAAPPPASETPMPATVATSTPAAVPAPVILATSDGEITGARVEVLELKRGSGDTVSLKFVLVNDAEKPFSFANYLGNTSIGSDYRSVGGTHLVDSAGKKKYLVVRDSETNCVCSREIQDAAEKSRVNLWAKFPAPPVEVQKVSIVVPHFGPMDDVPISP